MKVTEKDVRHVADLANLELTAEEQVRHIRDLNSVLEYINVLNELDTSNVKPFSSGVDSRRAPLRNDQQRPGLSHETALMNAPESDGIFFEVPKVVDKPGESKQ